MTSLFFKQCIHKYPIVFTLILCSDSFTLCSVEVASGDCLLSRKDFAFYFVLLLMYFNDFISFY